MKNWLVVFAFLLSVEAYPCCLNSVKMFAGGLALAGVTYGMLHVIPKYGLQKTYDCPRTHDFQGCCVSSSALQNSTARVNGSAVFRTECHPSITSCKRSEDFRRSCISRDPSAESDLFPEPIEIKKDWYVPTEVVLTGCSYVGAFLMGKALINFCGSSDTRGSTIMQIQ